MSITFYGGVMGSGKSYEVVSGPVCDAVAAGRRVVTNVAGINEERIHEYLLKKRPGLDAGKLGTIVHVTDERVMEPGFFPDEKQAEIDSVVKGGDLVAIDEAWRFWDQDKGKLSPEHMQFFRMHRHYVHPETGVTCDVVMMSQDIGGLARALKAVVELSFRMHKLKSIGVPTGYRVEMYEGSKQIKANRVSTFIKKYQKDIFPLYKSYEGDNARELRVDKRQNVLRDPKVIGVIALMVALWAFGGFFTYRFFAKRGEQAKPAAAESAGGGAHGQAASAAAAVPAPGNAKGGAPGSSGKDDYSAEWRIAGAYEANGERYMVVSDSQGRLRVESPSMFRNAGIAAIGEIDGQRVALWTGHKAGAGSIAPSMETKR
ncbi:zonular occludens toxin domain-containing protein [Cupriavidus neocaledonicus]|uniref:Zonular occludens toxin n=1 Tax=Cupriavidus neocaledonicus TaxID=1040979 RepID=A0ABY1UYT7_9BURK|nr:zonular occludens toxin domain-containing protein [Cupriavidus neocaledonicus]SOZ35594.1 Zonular occludens toxin [Cupriavidus neocaledonicus]